MKDDKRLFFLAIFHIIYYFKITLILPLTVVEGGRLGEQVAKDCTNGGNYRVGVQYVEAVDR
ncbi:MAG: hypothetical protein IJ232_07630 [Lachnospiraceae bacterium]|nr:hypothetical protein [Lachnospiraceae bacterium]